MEQIIEYKNGIYTGEVENGVPHGVGHYSHISTHDYDGLECRFVYHKRGIWTNDVLSGVVWEYLHEDATTEKTTESCVFQDEYGLVLLGIDRDGKLIGTLAKELTELKISYDRGMICRQDRRSWGKVIRDGHTFIGQFSSEKESPYYADDYVPHGFCIEMEDSELIYCGMFDMGERKGAGVIPSDDSDTPFTMSFQVI